MNPWDIIGWLIVGVLAYGLAALVICFICKRVSGEW